MRKRKPDPAPILEALPVELRADKRPAYCFPEPDMTEANRVRQRMVEADWVATRKRWCAEHGHTVFELYLAEFDAQWGSLFADRPHDE